MSETIDVGFGPKEGQLEAVRDLLLKKHEGEEIEYASCPQNGCFDMCLLKIHKKDGRMVAIETDNIIHENCGREDEYVDESEFYQGMFQHRACVRGRGWRQDVYSPNRIRYPMLRTGPKGSRQFERISWDKALDMIAEKYLETREKYGPLSVWCDGLMGGTNDYIGAYLPGGALAAWGVDSYEPHDFADTYSYGKAFSLDEPEFDGGTEAMTLLDAKAIVLWGVDILLNYPEFAYYFLLAKDKGIPIVSIEPRYTWTCHHSDQWIPIRPATDGAMLEAMAYTIFEEGLENKEFCEKWVEPEGLQRWKDHVMGGWDEVPKTPEWAEEICGVPAETIRGLARLIADGPVYMRQVWAATRMHAGENQARIFNYLTAITGNVGQKGTIGTGCDFGVLNHFLPRTPTMDYGMDPNMEVHNCVEGEIWHHAIHMREKYDAGEISLEEYKEEIGCPQNETPPNIKMIWLTVNPRNSAMGYYDCNSRIEALKKVPFVVYCAYTWVTATTWYADLVLPLCHQFFEGGGGSNFALVGGYSFNTHYSGNAGNYFIGTGKIVEPEGECRSKLWIFKEVAERVGVVDKFCPALKGLPWEGFYEKCEELAGEGYERWRQEPQIARLEPPDWEDFKKLPYFIRPIEGDYYVWMKKNIENDIPLNTPSGKIEIVSHFVDEKDYHTVQFRTKTYGKGEVSPIGRYKMPPYSLLQPVVREYPLYLITPHAFYRQHFCQDENPWFRDEYRVSVWMSVADAKVRNIKDGDMVLCQNQVGQILLPAYVTSRLLPGVTCMIFGRNYEPSEIKTDIMPGGIDRGGSCNFLIPEDHFWARRGILFCNSMIDIVKADRSMPGIYS